MMPASHESSVPALQAAIRLFDPVHRQLRRAMEESLSGSGLTIPMRAVLERLYETGARTVPALARAFGVQRQFTQRVVDALAEAGHVERAANAAHRRSPLIRLTDTGRQAIEDVLGREQALLADLARGLDADDVEATGRVLEQLARALAAGETPPGPSGS